MKTDTSMINPPAVEPVWLNPFHGFHNQSRKRKKSTRLHVPDALSSFFDRIQYSIGGGRREDDIRATLDDIYTT